MEANSTHQRFIAQTAQKLKLDAVQSIRSNVFTFLKSGFVEQFDTIFADPPYDLENLDTIPDLVLSKGLLREGGVFVFEHSAAYDFSGMERFWQRKSYGSVNFSLFR